MTPIYLQSLSQFSFNIKRGENTPSEIASFTISSEGENLEEDLLFSNSGPLEYSLNESTWGSLTFSLGSPLETTRVFVRAKGNVLNSVTGASIPVGNLTIPYSVIVQTTPSHISDYQQSLQVRSSNPSVFCENTHTVTLKNYDQVISPSNSLLLKVSSGFEIAVQMSGLNYGPFLNTIEITEIPSESHPLVFKVRASKDKAAKTQATYFVEAKRGNGEYYDLTSGEFIFTGAVVTSRGKPFALSGVSGELCQPTSFCLDCVNGPETLTYQITASSGFLVGIQPDGTEASSQINNLSVAAYESSSTLIYVFLDPSTVITSTSGQITIAQNTTANANGGFPAFQITIPESTNSPATPIPVFRWKNMILPTEGSPLVNPRRLYRQTSSGEAPTFLSLAPSFFTVKYAGSPFYKNPNANPSELYNVIADPIDYTNLLTVPPQTPGLWEVIISWPGFSQNGVVYASGELNLPYTILPTDTTSDIYYGVSRFIQYLKISSHPSGLQYSVAPIAKDLDGTTVATLPNVVYTGQGGDGLPYESTTPPTYPGDYAAKFYLSDVDITLKSVEQDFSTVKPHNYQNGDQVTLLEFQPSFAQNLFNFNPSEGVVEVVGPNLFKIKKGSDYLKCGTYTGFTFQHPVTNENIYAVQAFDFSTVKSPNVGNTSEYDEDFTVAKRKISLFLPALFWSSAKNQIENQNLIIVPNTKLPSDTLTVNAKLISCEDLETTSESINANDSNLRNYKQTYQLEYVGGQTTLSKYNLPTQLQIVGGVIYRESSFAYSQNMEGPFSKEYDKSDWVELNDWLGTGAIYGADYSSFQVNVEVSATAFGKNLKTGNLESNSNAGTYLAYLETLSSGLDSSNFFIAPYGLRIPTLSISARELLVTSPVELSKVYNRSALRICTQSEIPLSGILSNDDVYVSSVSSNRDVSAQPQLASSVELSGQHANNYFLSNFSNLKIAISPKPVNVRFDFTKDYNGKNDSKIKLTTTYFGAQTPFQTEPICLSKSLCSFVTGDVGEAKTSSDTLTFTSLNASNYNFTIVYNNQTYQLRFDSLTNDALNNASLFDPTRVTGHPQGQYKAGDKVYFDGKLYLANFDNDAIPVSNPVYWSLIGEISPFPSRVNAILGKVSQVPLLLSPSGIGGTRAYNGTTDVVSDVEFSLLGVAGDDTITKADLDYTAVLANPNRGVRACTVSLNGILATSPYFGNYAPSGTAVGAFTVSPKLVNTALASQWLILDGVKGANSIVFQNQTPTVSFEIPETPLNTSLFSHVFGFSGSAVPEAKVAGSYEVRLLFPDWSSPSSTSNYRPDPLENAEYVSIPFSITQRPIWVNNVVASSRAYGSSNWPAPYLTFDVDNAAQGSDPQVTVTGTYTSATGVFVPASSINLQYVIEDQNYVLDPRSPVSITGVVTPKNVTISSDVDSSSITKVYDGTPAISSIRWLSVPENTSPQLNGVLPADSSYVSVDVSSLETAEFTFKDSGPRAVVSSFVLTGEMSGNYKLVQPTYNGQINPKPITFSGLISSSKVFDGLPTASIIPTNDGFRYEGLIPSEEQNYLSTPVGQLSAYFENYRAGTGKVVRLKGLLPPTINYTITYLSGTEDELLMPTIAEGYTINKRMLTVKPKDISKYYGDLIPQSSVNLPAEDFIILGLVEENKYNAIDATTGKNHPDKIQSASRFLENGFQQNTPTGILSNVSYAYSPVFVLNQGLLSDYEFTNGQTEVSLKGSVVIENVAFKNLTKTIKEAIWAAECTSFGCKDLNWFELIAAPNRYIVAVDLKNTIIPQSDPPEYLADQKLELEQTVSSDPEVLISEG